MAGGEGKSGFGFGKDEFDIAIQSFLFEKNCKIRNNLLTWMTIYVINEL